MITLYGFGRLKREVIGETRDLRAQWALEETGLPYKVYGLDHTGGEMDEPEFGRISCFHLLPVIDDDGFIVAESGAVLIYLAEKAGKLIPTDFEGRTRVTQWCFSALSTVERPMMEIQLIGDGDDEASLRRREEMRKEAGRWLGGLERRLQGRQWIAAEKFTVADILLATVLREIRKTDLMNEYENVGAYYARAMDRPAWRKTMALYAERLGVTVAEIQ